MSKQQPLCTFGVHLHEDGSIEEIKEGEFDMEHAERLANHLTLLAVRILKAAESDNSDNN